MKIQARTVWIGAFVLALAYLPLRFVVEFIDQSGNEKEKEARAKAKYEKIWYSSDREFFAGALPDLPGPYLDSGNVLELKYTVINLDNTYGNKFTETGDLLLGHANSDSHSKSTHISFSGASDRFLLTRTEKIISLPPSDLVLMEPNGVVHLANETAGGSWELVAKKEKILLTARELSPVPDQSVLTSSDGYHINYGVQSPGVYTYYDESFHTKTIQLAHGQAFFPLVTSSKLGVIGSVFDRANEHVKIGIFKNNHLTIEVFPYDGGMNGIFTSGDNVAFDFHRGRFVSAPFMRAGPRTYVRMKIPRQSVSCSINAINAQGDCLLVSLDPNGTEKSASRWIRRRYLVIEDKSYDLNQLLETALPSLKYQNLEDENITLGANGDLLVQTSEHRWLLRRQKAKP